MWNDGYILAWGPSYNLLHTRLVSRYAACLAWLESTITVPAGEGTQVTGNYSNNVRYLVRLGRALSMGSHVSDGFPASKGRDVSVVPKLATNEVAPRVLTSEVLGCIERDGRASRQGSVCRREPPARRGQAGTHHVCACEEKANRAAV
jgi:hypothetical protein